MYDEKTKGNVKMPKGIYDSLKISIGNAKGENWWSLIFPYSVEGQSMSELIENDDIEFESIIVNFIENIFK